MEGAYEREPVGSLSSPGAARAAALFPADVIFEIATPGHEQQEVSTLVAAGINPAALAT